MIVSKVVCDFCKNEINKGKEDAVTIHGNLCVIGDVGESGVGAGVLGGHKWLDRLVDYRHEDESDIPVEYDDVPVHHVHIDCIRSIYSSKRG